MTNYREILRLSCLGLNKAQIAGACGCSRTTVIKVLNIAAAQGLSYPLPDGMSDKQLADKGQLSRHTLCLFIFWSAKTCSCQYRITVPRKKYELKKTA